MIFSNNTYNIRVRRTLTMYRPLDFIYFVYMYIVFALTFIINYKNHDFSHASKWCDVARRTCIEPLGGALTRSQEEGGCGPAKRPKGCSDRKHESSWPAQRWRGEGHKSRQQERPPGEQHEDPTRTMDLNRRKQHSSKHCVQNKKKRATATTPGGRPPRWELHRCVSLYVMDIIHYIYICTYM